MDSDTTVNDVSKKEVNKIILKYIVMCVLEELIFLNQNVRIFEKA